MTTTASNVRAKAGRKIWYELAGTIVFCLLVTCHFFDDRTAREALADEAWL